MDKELKERLKNKIAYELDLRQELDDRDVGRIIDKCIMEEIGINIPLKEQISLKNELFNSYRRLDVLTEFLEDDSITEIMVNGYDNIFLEINGNIIKSDKQFESEERLKAVVQQIVAGCNRRINESSPIVDARLSDGSRVNVVISPVSLTGSIITIRKFSKQIMDMDTLVKYKSLTKEISNILEILVKAKYNIFISGGTGSGKTTFLNALSNFIPSDERIITIEDAAELKIQGISNLVRMEARNSNTEGKNEITIRQLIKTSLRMRPDRIIVGEVRDYAAIDMLQAMNTGHDGSLSTGHGNSDADMLSRLETMVLTGMDIPILAVRKQIASALDIIIHLGRIRDKSRKVLKISEVTGMTGGEISLNTIFEFQETGEKEGRVQGKLVKINELIDTGKLLRSGLIRQYQEACSEIKCV